MLKKVKKNVVWVDFKSKCTYQSIKMCDLEKRAQPIPYICNINQVKPMKRRVK
jgi:hypothetical protein